MKPEKKVCVQSGVVAMSHCPIRGWGHSKDNIGGGKVRTGEFSDKLDGRARRRRIRRRSTNRPAWVAGTDASLDTRDNLLVQEDSASRRRSTASSTRAWPPLPP